MKYFTLVISLICIVSCANDKMPLKGETDFQRELNAQFKDASKSPLSEKERKYFKGLDFFPVDSSYVVTAFLQRTPDSTYFDMKTTTERVARERVYGILHFELDERHFQLNVYQEEPKAHSGVHTDHLFLPFLDATNGDETYGGGRYIDLTIPEGDAIIIDFNKAYNPTCVYNKKYSCPIVPRVNMLDIPIRAGVKMYIKE